MNPNPDFIIGGAARAGTTWLVRAMELHPSIRFAQPIAPEPKFFHVDHIYAKGIDYYLRTWFSDMPEEVVCGEKSTNYLSDPNSAARIRKHLPDVKLIFILREPGMRAWSNYLWSKMNGYETESFLRALELEEERERTLPEKLKFARPHAYFSRGLYAEQLGRYFDLFPRENLCCLNFNDIVRAPGRVLERVHAFLGVPSRPGDARGLGDINGATGEDEDMGGEARAWLDERYRRPNAELAALLGSGFPLWSEKL